MTTGDVILDPGRLAALAGELCAEIRATPPATGVGAVEIPGQREAAIRMRRSAGSPMAPRAWEAPAAEAQDQGLDPAQVPLTA